MTNPTHDGEYLVATISEYGYLLWSVADCYKWYKLPERKEELNANP